MPIIAPPAPATARLARGGGRHYVEKDQRNGWLLLQACFTPRTEFHSVRIFTFGHLEFEYAGHFFSIKLADSTMILFDRCTLRTMEGAPLESESQPEPGRQSKAAPRAPNVQRLATGDG